jgi:hypothetical protein
LCESFIIFIKSIVVVTNSNTQYHCQHFSRETIHPSLIPKISVFKRTRVLLFLLLLLLFLSPYPCAKSMFTRKLLSRISSVSILQLSNHMSKYMVYEFLYDFFKRVLTRMLNACCIKHSYSTRSPITWKWVIPVLCVYQKNPIKFTSLLYEFLQ